MAEISQCCTLWPNMFNQWSSDWFTDGDWMTAQKRPTQHYIRWFPQTCQWQGQRCEGEVRMPVPFSGVFLWCGKVAWFHQSTWPPDAHFPAFLTPERILETRRGGCLIQLDPLFWARTLIKKHWQLKQSLHEYSWCVVLCCDIKCKYMWPQRKHSRQNMMF